ncbi:Malate-2H(+)/Na(+)-lactate antiporter [uncultured Eubacterium sp.]|nr:Malate-2H(+)/Na(+)-lactate antiporter [uncultured Eubacterium sp.]
MDFGILSILPPLLAILLAFITKNVLLSLIAAVFVGATMIAGNPIVGFVDIFGNYMIPKIADPWNAGVIAMTLFVGCFSVMLERGGGAWAFGQAVKDKITTRKQGQIAGWIGGLMIFFSDSSNSVIVGPILRAVTDRLKISREKLAYICDSTASSVPLLLPITGWGALVMGIYKESLPAGTNLVDVFVKSVPFNLYTITIILMVLVIAVTGWDFGPMRKAEIRARKLGKLVADDAHIKKSETFQLKEGAHPTAWGLIAPLIVLIGSLFATMYYTGPKGEGFMNTITNSDTMLSLTVAFFSAALVGVLIAMKNKVLTFKESYQVFIDGFQQMIEAILILIFAWCIGGVTSDVGAADYIVEATRGFMTPGIMFISLFVTACITSFATGSSWGSFAIFLPIAIPLALANDVSIYPAIGASLAGSLFGDHCSPISDSTILASLGASCDHLAHVKTQLPYAVLAALASIAGFVTAAITMNGFISLAVSIVCMVAFLYVMNKVDRKRYPENEMAE